jgi:hypothetical protein
LHEYSPRGGNNVRLETERRIGEGFVHETELFYRLDEYFKTLKICMTGSLSFEEGSTSIFGFLRSKRMLTAKAFSIVIRLIFFRGEELFKANQ